jgi:hypothetical protein
VVVAMVEVKILPHEAEDRMTVEVVYTRSEWHRLEALYKKLKCKEKEHGNLNLRMYGECEVHFTDIVSQLQEAIQFRTRTYTIDVYDDPGLHSFIDYTSVNIAMFRVIPDCDARTCNVRLTFESRLIYSKVLDMLPRIFNNYVDLLELLMKSVRIVVEVVT